MRRGALWIGLRRRAAVCAIAAVSLSSTVLAGDLESRLIEAVKRRDVPVVRGLLKDGADVNGAEGDGATPLAWAAHRDDTEIAALLLRSGARVNAANHYGVTPLSLACTNRSAAMVEALLEAGADPNLAAASGETALLVAARTGDVGVMKLLMMRGGEVNTRERRREQTPLMWAVSGGHRDLVRLLIEGGADVNAASSTGFTPLMFAARQGDVDAARALIKAGADAARTAADGANALMVAAGSLSLPDDGRERTAMALLDDGADPNTVAFGYSVLQVAVATGKPDLVSALLMHGANPNVRAMKSRGGGAVRIPEGATAFWLAAREVNAALMRTLAAAGADTTSTPADGTTALMTAAGVGQVEGPRAKGSFASPYRSRWDEGRALAAVAAALDLGGEINAVNTAKGWSALHGAAHIGADRMVRFLVEHGAALHVPDKNGQTPLSLASEGARDQLTRIPHRSTADLLVKLGAMPVEPVAPVVPSR